MTTHTKWQDTWKLSYWVFPSNLFRSGRSFRTKTPALRALSVAAKRGDVGAYLERMKRGYVKRLAVVTEGGRISVRTK